MKTMLITFLFLGTIQLMNAQSDLAYADVSTTSRSKNQVVKTHDVSKNDLKSVYIAEKVSKMQQEVANYDIKNSNVYDANLETTYSVNFTEGNNQIKAVYSKNGVLLNSEGIFENVRIPLEIGVNLAKTYPGWEFNKSWCYSSSETNKDPKLIYKILLKKGDTTKIVKINPYK